MILVIGSPRSGTSWLGKIFDSHPDVVYRHEPDFDVTADEIPHWVHKAECDQYADAARDYLETLCKVSTIRSSGILPTFPKRYRGSMSSRTRLACVYAIKFAERVPLVRSVCRRLPIPDFIGKSSPHVPVVKSVRSLGRAGLFSHSIGGGKIVIILRHPCGYVASLQRGQRLGKAGGKAPIKAMSETAAAQRRGVTYEQLEACTETERMAWHWVFSNDHALFETEGCENVRVIRYEDLCLKPVEIARGLFDFCELSWDDQTAAYIDECTHASGEQRYFSLRRNSAEDVEKWRKELEDSEIEQILGVISSTPSGQYYLESEDRVES